MRSRSAAQVATLTIVAAIAMATEGRPVFGDEPTERIVRIDVECPEPFDEEGVRQLLPFDIGDIFRPEAIAEAQRLLSLREVFSSIDIESQPVPAGMRILIQLRRYPLINLIRFRGNDALGDETLRRITKLRSSHPLTTDAEAYAVERIRERYVSEGFPAATVQAGTSEIALGEVNVEFGITEGRPLLISSVDIDGAPESSLGDLQDALEVEPGDRYTKETQSKATKTIVTELRRHGWYEAKVQPLWEQQGNYAGRLLFQVKAGPELVIEFRGNEQLSREDLTAPMNLLDRPIITDGTWRQLARRAVQTYQEAGFHRAAVTLVGIEQGDARLRKSVVYDVNEGRRYYVWRIGFEGNRSLPDEELRSVMQTRPPSWIPWHRGVLIDEQLSKDLEQISALYQEDGFLEVKVGKPVIKYGARSGGIAIRIPIVEGPQTRVVAMTMTGVEPLKDRLPPLRTKVGRPLNYAVVEEDRRSVLIELVNAGYPDAEVSADVRIQAEGAGGASIEFKAESNRQVRVGKIIVQGNFDTDANVIERELPFHSGDILDPDQLLEGQGRIYQLGLFRSVTVRAADVGDDPGVRDVFVRVAEKPPGSFQWGVGYNTRDGFRGVGQVGYRNMRRRGDAIALRGQVDLEVGDVKPSQYLGDISYRQPNVLDTWWSGSLKFLAQRTERDIDNFKLQRFALIPGLERPLASDLIAGVAVQFDRTQVFDLSSEIKNEKPPGCTTCRLMFDDARTFISVSLDPFLVRNRLDDEFRPTSGTFESLRLRIAPGALGTDVPIVKVIGQHSHYIPIGRYLTFLYAVRVGWARALEDHKQVPIQERFFLGGRTTVRGFSENSIGPEARGESDTTDDMDEEKQRTPPLGGDVSVNTNVELHFPLVYGLRGAVFCDTGGVFLQTYNAKGERYRESAGVGLRYLTPVGALSLDYGFKLDRRAGESLGEIHFSVGRIF